MPQIVIDVSPDLQYADRYLVEDGTLFRAHDAVLVLETIVGRLKQRGAARFQTASEVAAEDAKIAAANDVLKDWEPTLAGVSCYGETYSRMFRHVSGAEMVAVCDSEGRPTLATADALAKWTPPEV